MQKYLIVFLMVLVSCGYHSETVVKQDDCNGKYEVATYIRKGMETKLRDAHFSWGENFKGLSTDQVPAAIEEHKKWASATIANLKRIDSLLNTQ